MQQTAFDLEQPGLFGGGTAAALSVTLLTRHLSAVLCQDEILSDVWVQGEVSNLTRAASGHLYFSLKDDGACVSCIMFRSAACFLSFRPAAGMQVLAHGRIGVYAPRGQYQLDVDDLQPDGLGALHLALEQSKARLLAEGLLDAGRKRPFPAFPQRAAIVTSLTGAAVQDMCSVLCRVPCPPDIVLVPALVQGAAAEESLIAALRLADERSGASVILLGRGGGSVEDLWVFNSEKLARAIAACRLPVVSAVGHETDFTLADLAADLRAPTPTAAAEMVVDAREEMIRRWQSAAAQARELFLQRVELARLRLEGLQRRSPLARPESMVEARRSRLEALCRRLDAVRERSLSRWRHRLALAAGKLEGMSPLATLARGYARVVRLPEGTPVMQVADIRAGDRVQVRLVDGTFDAAVMEIRSEAEGTGQPREDRSRETEGDMR